MRVGKHSVASRILFFERVFFAYVTSTKKVYFAESAFRFSLLCGARASVNGQSVSVGGAHLLSELKVVVPPELEKTATARASAEQTVLYVIVDARVIGGLAVEDDRIVTCCVPENGSKSGLGDSLQSDCHPSSSRTFCPMAN
jgi:hypothetical protein